MCARPHAPTANYAETVARGPVTGVEKVDRQEQILEAALSLLAEQGISGVSMRAVARRAGVALGLVHYYFDDKSALIAAALRRVESMDLEIVEPDPELPATEQVIKALHRIADPEFLTTDYLSLRLQLWALARAHSEYEEINTTAQRRYRDGLASLIAAARPGLSTSECDRRAADINVVQNGMWLTALLGLDRASIERSVQRTEEIALAD